MVLCFMGFMYATLHLYMFFIDSFSSVCFAIFHVLSFLFYYWFLDACLFSDKREKERVWVCMGGMVRENLGGVGGDKIIIRISCVIKKPVSIKGKQKKKNPHVFPRFVPIL